MRLNLPHRSLADFARMSEQDLTTLCAQARALQAPWRNGTTPPVLRGRNLALLLGAPGDRDAAIFRRAASALGAQVAQLDPHLSERSSDDEIRHTAAVLGRLYDAADCLRMAPALVRRIGADAGMPVFEDMASPAHPIARLGDLLDADMPADDRRCLLIQAVLVSALG